MRTLFQAPIGRMSRRKRSDNFWGYAMVAPCLLGLLIFYIWPVLQTVYYSLCKFGAFNKHTFQGLDNYVRLFQDQDVLGAFVNTALFTMAYVPVTIFLAIIVAVLLNQNIRGRSVYRVLYYLPVITMPAAVAMVWRWLYNADFGLFNHFLRLIGVEPKGWLTDPKLALGSIAVVAIWSGIGYRMIIFLSGLQGISSQYYEAAEIDGAGPLHKFFSITLPLLTPTIFFTTIITLINALQVFDIIFMMIASDGTSVVLKETQSVVYLFYQYAFVLNNKGYASAIAIVLFAIIMLLTAIQMKLQEKWVTYE